MAQQSSWAYLQNDPLMKRLAAYGQSALDSGAVTKEQAAQWASNMGVLPAAQAQQPTPSSMGTPPGTLPIGVNPSVPGQSQHPLSMTAQDLYNSQGMGDTSNRPGMKVGAERQDTSNFKRSSTRFTRYSPEDVRAMQLQAQGQYPEISGYEPATDEQGNPQFDRLGKQVLDRDQPIYDFDHLTVDENNPVRMQEKGLDRMNGLLGMEATYQGQKNHMDFTPLAALADAENARNGLQTNLAASAEKPKNDNNFMAYADEIQKRRADIQKAISEGVRAQRSGSTMDMLLQAQLDKNTAGQETPYDKYHTQDRLDNTDHQATLRYLRSDKNLRDKLVQYQNISNALNNYAAADVHTPQQFDELQQAIRANLGIKGSSGVGERDRTTMNSLGLSADRITQILTGNPQQVKNDAFDAHMKNLATLEGSNIKQQYNSRLNAIAAGNGSMYARRPDLAADLQEAIAANAAQVAAPVSRGSSKKAPPRTQAQKVSQGGGNAVPGFDPDHFLKGGQ